MRPADYRAALKAAQTEIQEILGQRAVLDDRLNQLKKTVDALSALLKENPALDDGFSNAYRVLASIEGLSASGAGDMGISDAIRQILLESKTPLTPPEIKTHLWNRGFNLGGYANALAVIHNTLKRLNKQGEIAGIVGTAGEVTSYVINQHHPAMLLRKRTVPPPPGSDDPVEDALKQDFEGPIPNPGVGDTPRRESWRTPPPPKSEKK